MADYEVTIVEKKDSERESIAYRAGFVRLVTNRGPWTFTWKVDGRVLLDAEIARFDGPIDFQALQDICDKANAYDALMKVGPTGG